MKSDLHTASAARLAARRDRYTTARRALVDVLSKAAHPLTVGEIVERSHGLASSSVYRNLAVLEDGEVVRRLAGHGEFQRFELADHPMGHHHHLACSSCGAMIDVELPPALEAQLDQTLARVARRNHFQVESHWLDAIGTCDTCASS